MTIGKLATTLFAAAFLSCAGTNQTVVPVSVPGAEQTEPTMLVNLEKQIIKYGNINYDFTARPLKTEKEEFGPVIPATMTRLYSTTDHSGKSLRYASEQFETERHPHTLWIQLPGTWLKLEIGRDNSVWGEQRLEICPNQLEDKFYN